MLVKDLALYLGLDSFPGSGFIIALFGRSVTCDESCAPLHCSPTFWELLDITDKNNLTHVNVVPRHQQLLSGYRISSVFTVHLFDLSFQGEVDTAKKLQNIQKL